MLRMGSFDLWMEVECSALAVLTDVLLHYLVHVWVALGRKVFLTCVSEDRIAIKERVDETYN